MVCTNVYIILALNKFMSIVGDKSVTFFDSKFWIDRFRELGYAVKGEEYPVSVLKEMKVIPTGTDVLKSQRLFNNNLIEIVLIEVKGGLTRGKCVSMARAWKKNTLRSPLMVLTDGRSSYLTVVPGNDYEEVRVLFLSDEIYHTDELAIQSMYCDPDSVALFKKYNESFLPYEKVRDEFFEGYSKRFLSLVTILKKHLEERKANEYAQRFLGRLMFLYFLQKKGWLAGNKRFIDTISDFRDMNRIFYDGLNNKDNDYNLPFLNGSLFDREGYLTEKLEKELEPEMTIFFIDVRKFFNEYNFTVDESSPLEKEVGIDPYLLGTVFENMLPENERGSKGTFYTPPAEISFIIRRGISNYMVLNGFKTKDETRDGKLEDGVDRYIQGLGKSRNSEELDEFKDKLLNAVVMDPAVGSGGFLVMYMDEVVRMINDAELAVIGEITSPKILKEKIMRNIYGFDIENEAVEIARLRVWLSYVIDEDRPRPLPNLDLNIVAIEDSLVRSSESGASVSLENIDKLNDYNRLKDKYMASHDPREKKELRAEVVKIGKQLHEGNGGNTIEGYLAGKSVNIIVMNPPYVRQESIPGNSKEYYVKTYRLDRKSDIYAYFFARAVDLLGPKGIASVITSDKWLETGYGMKLQSYLKSRLIAVYGQRERSFGADINTVISVFTDETLSAPVAFTYLEKYSSYGLRRSMSIPRSQLEPGKWFYLRAPKLFMEKIYPKLTHKLGDFAEIKRGFTTGANDFFYMKDVSAQYEADYFANPKRFKEWGVKAKNEKELKERDLIYIENESGERFVIDAKDVIPLVKSIREVKNYIKNEAHLLCLYTDKPGPFTEKYIRYGETKEVAINANNTKGKIVKVVGYQSLETTKSRKMWYRIADIKQTRIVLQHFFMGRLFSPVFKNSVAVDAALYYFIPKSGDFSSWGLYLNGTLFLMCRELYSWRMGGGVGQMMIKDYEELLVPDIRKIHFMNTTNILDRTVKVYLEETKMEDRRELDKYIFKQLGLDEIDIDEFYREFIELVEDRLIKADRPLKRTEEEHDEDN